MNADARATPHTLVRSLINAGPSRADTQGLGRRVDDTGRLDAGQRIWTLGALCRGRDGESTAIPEIRQQARRIAV